MYGWVNLDKCMCALLSHFTCVWLFEILWTIAHQALLSMGFSRQEYWSGLPFPSPGDLPKPENEPRSHILQADSILELYINEILLKVLHAWLLSLSTNISVIFLFVVDINSFSFFISELHFVVWIYHKFNILVASNLRQLWTKLLCSFLCKFLQTYILIYLE